MQGPICEPPPPLPATGVFRALRARSVPGVCPRVSPKTGGVRGSVPRGVSAARRAQECPKSVPRVSAECLKHLFDTARTLSGHFLDTPEPFGPETPCETLPRTAPVFRDALGNTRGTLRARRAWKTHAAGRCVRKYLCRLQRTWSRNRQKR